MDRPLWTPSAQRVSGAQLTAFIEHCNQQGNHQANQRRDATIRGYAELYRWSIDEPTDFWRAVWSFCDIRASREATAVVVDFDKMPGARWFPGARLNFADNLLRFDDDRIALIGRDERGRRQTLSYAQLRSQVASAAAWLRAAGITTGDRVAAVLPNVPEAVVAMLAATSLGAVWSSTSPDFGVQGILDRFSQIEPKLLFVADACQYGGKRFDCLTKAQAVAQQLPTLERLVVVPRFEPDAPPAIKDRRRGPLCVPYAELMEHQPNAVPRFEQLPFDHPVYILYSSGTTGPPKCITHGAGGTLIQHLKELRLHTDLTRDDRILYVTTCGWMMWNWLVSSLAVGATVVLYDGSPMAPATDSLWDLAEDERLTVFGASAPYLAAMEKAELRPVKTHDLSALRCILSTGAPLSPESFDYVYSQVKRDVQLSSISGGTDIVSCFALGNPIGPVWRGELQTRGLGMNVQVFDDQGRPAGREQGELVCVAPFPSMPVGFWNDPDGVAYRQAYFDMFPGVWRHGDWVQLTEHDGMLFHGRSDAVLNPGGVRIGTAEIYRQVSRAPEVLESVVVGQPWEGDTRIVLFVKLRPGVRLDEPLADRIRQQIRDGASPRHVPRRIVQVDDIPRTRSGKIVELAVRDVLAGRPVRNLAALANPAALAQFRLET